MKPHCLMQMGLRIWLPALPQLDPALISGSFSLVPCPFLFPPPLIFPFLLHYYCQNLLIMKYCFCLTAEMGREKRARGVQGAETDNHNERKKRGSGFSIKARAVEMPQPPLSSPLPALCMVCVCVCVSALECFLQCVEGVISLLYIAPLKSLFKG